MRLILIPAFACDARLYGSLIELLRGDYDCAVVIPAEPTMEACAAAALAEAGEGPFIVCGTSFGGHVAREMAFAAPDRIAGLIVMGAGAGAPASQAVYDERHAAIENGRAGEMLETMARAIVFEEEGRGEAAADMFRAMAAAADPAVLLAQNAALARRPDRRDDVARLACRTLLIWGEEDRFSPPADGADMAARMVQAEYVTLTDCGHLPSLEAPMRVAAEIRRVFVPSGRGGTLA
ncbi:alpha/beta fold hydrolase [Mangrovicella endophytica]|uniref:alpha/beta fold hydrolase n=1 Tax=Mangrovicella endophytica TaxID=2066697 RepID=UPI000C9EA139|nr:alpha/beta hydrolase [Mangrovicella endophytica]